jgi:hypothetical protein
MAGDDNWMGDGFRTETDDLASFNANGTANAQNFSNSAQRGVVSVTPSAVAATGRSNLAEAVYFRDLHRMRLDEAAQAIVLAQTTLFALAAGAQTIEYNYAGSDAMNSAGIADVTRTFDPNLPPQLYEGGYAGGYLTTPDGEQPYGLTPQVMRTETATPDGGRTIPLPSAPGAPESAIVVEPDNEGANQRDPWTDLQNNKAHLGQGDAVLPPAEAPPAESSTADEPAYDYGYGD